MINLTKTTLSALLFVAGLGAAQNANALTITGITGPKYLVSGSPVTSSVASILKISFENNTAGTNLSLCAGSATDFETGTCSTELAASGGPGFVFLALQDASKLNGKFIYVLRNVGTAASKFTFVIE